MAAILDLDLVVDFQDPLPTIRQIVKSVKPEWNIQHVTYDDVSTGYVNQNYKVQVTDSEDAILIRCSAFDKVNPDLPKQQKRLHTFVHQENLGAKLYCTFTNGVCMEFIRGKTMTWDTRHQIYEPNIWPQTAEIMAMYHSKEKFEKAKKFDGIPNRITDEPNKDGLLAMIDVVKNMNPESDLCKAMPNSKEVNDEIFWALKTCQELGLKQCMVHMDANPTNFLVRDNDGKLVLLDYDLLAIFFAGADIAWFFLLHFDIRICNLEEYPPLEYQNKWLNHYLTKRRELDGEQDQVTDTDIEKLHQEVDAGLLPAYLQLFVAVVLIRLISQTKGAGELKEKTILIAWEAYKNKKAEYVKRGF